ncbi:MAG TPA: inositol monophosphatase family protein [Abditibacterium sp.]|jgi:myo-inositol-1(or 4)-monophosphatase
MNLEPYLDFTRELANAAAAVINPYFCAPDCGLEQKFDDSPVTLADRGAEEVMRAMIERQFPTHGIIGEEFGSHNADAEWVWILDPVDGTKSFISAVPLFGTLIGLLYQGKPVVGCINQSILGQMLLGDGTTTTLNGKTVRVRACASVEQATLLTTDPLRPRAHFDGAAFENLASRARLFRSWGDCYGYLLLCSGWADAMLDPKMAPWDFLPLLPVLRGAGAKVTNWRGEEVDCSAQQMSLVASAPEIHEEILRSLNP